MVCVALIEINGVAIPTPSEFSVGVMDISKAERNANGNLIIERINTKKKLSLKYSYLSATNLSTVLSSISSTTFTVRYLDPATNSFKSSKFYTGDRAVGMIDFQNNTPRYKEVQFDLIEV
jgi:hypothetical protein